LAYSIPEIWNPEDIEIKLLDEASEGEVATVRVSVGGAALFIVGEIKEDGKRLVVTGVHISSHGMSPNQVGVPNLRQVARAVMEIGSYDEIIVEGGSGSNNWGTSRASTRFDPVLPRSSLCA
jgi:hypothetical protein